MKALIVIRIKALIDPLYTRERERERERERDEREEGFSLDLKTNLGLGEAAHLLLVDQSVVSRLTYAHSDPQCCPITGRGLGSQRNIALGIGNWEECVCKLCVRKSACELVCVCAMSV